MRHRQGGVPVHHHRGLQRWCAHGDQPDPERQLHGRQRWISGCNDQDSTDDVALWSGVLDSDAVANFYAIAIDHASQRADAPKLSFEKVAV